MSCLKNDAVHTMNFFFQNDMFCTLDLFILLLKQTYDDVSHKHNAATKLENLQQWNHKFTSFFSEFLNLVEEFKWNETAKIDVFRQKIFDEIQIQFIDYDFSNTLLKFIILCQQINKNIHFADIVWFQKILIFWLTIFITQTVCLTKNLISAEELMNIDIKNVQQYILIKFNE